jgi:hypothetical protein
MSSRYLNSPAPGYQDLTAAGPGGHRDWSYSAAKPRSALGDRRQLTVSSDGDPGVTRSFGSFQAAANEATLSRIVAGQYTMIDLGRRSGRASRCAMSVHYVCMTGCL